MGEGVLRMTEKRLTPTARKLRRNRTAVEDRLWRRIRSRQLDGAKFTFQFPIGPHIADFACRSARLAIELDGGQHSPGCDADRTKTVESYGYRIIRFWNNDVMENMEGVLEVIRHELRIARNAS